jgi:hypothetical protein
MSNDKGSAFVKGGCGCLLAFLAIGLIFVLLGGSMHIDLGGAIVLFVVGGVIGLVVLAVYNKGRRDAVDREAAFQEQRGANPHSEHTDADEVGGAWVNCPHCGARVNPATGEGLHSPGGQSWVLICDTCQHRVEPSG